MKMNRVAILMPVFNEEKYIVEAINSVLEFSYPEDFFVELIVVDDFSSDRTFALAADLQAKYKSALNLKRNKCKGKNHAFNEAISGAECDYVCLMGGDDKLVPSALVSRVRILQEKFAISETAQVGNTISVCKIRTFSEQKRFDGILIPKKIGAGTISGGSVLMPFGLTRTIFPLPVDVPNEDTWLSLHFRYRNIDVLHVGDVGLLYRIHEQNSHKRGVGFTEFQNSMWARGRVILSFYIEHSKGLDKAKERKLLAELVVECLKSLGSTWAIIFLGKIGIKEKLKALTYASPAVYYLKQKFYKYLVGR